MRIKSKQETSSAGVAQGITLEGFIKLHDELLKKKRTSSIPVWELWHYVLMWLPYKIALSSRVRCTNWYRENIKQTSEADIFYSHYKKKKISKQAFLSRIEKGMEFEEAIKPFETRVFYKRIEVKDDKIIIYSKEENDIIKKEFEREIRKLENEESKSDEIDPVIHTRLENLKKDYKNLIFAMKSI